VSGWQMSKLMAFLFGVDKRPLGREFRQSTPPRTPTRNGGESAQSHVIAHIVPGTLDV
jgi:hypothetical protein